MLLDPGCMFGSIGLLEVVALGLVVAILFGARRIPDLLGGLGKGIREFRRGLSGEGDAGAGANGGPGAGGAA